MIFISKYVADWGFWGFFCINWLQTFKNTEVQGWKTFTNLSNMTQLKHNILELSSSIIEKKHSFHTFPSNSINFGNLQ